MGLKYQKISESSEFSGKERATLELAIISITDHITIVPCGTFTPEDIVSTTVAMAMKRYSPTAICKVPNQNIPSATTFWTCVNTLNYDELLKNSAAMFRNSLHQLLKKGQSYTFATDEVDDPFYGKKVAENEDLVVGGKLKKSTCFFYRYITLYTTMRNRRVTLAVFPIQNSMSKLFYIQQIVQIIRSEGYGIKAFLLDRGFFSGEIFHGYSQLIVGR